MQNNQEDGAAEGHSPTCHFPASVNDGTYEDLSGVWAHGPQEGCTLPGQLAITEACCAFRSWKRSIILPASVAGIAFRPEAPFGTHGSLRLFSRCGTGVGDQTTMHPDSP